jgi:hypothetical protein
VFRYHIILPTRGSESSLLWPRYVRSDFYLTFNQLHYTALTSLSPLVCIFIFTVYITTSDADDVHTSLLDVESHCLWRTKMRVVKLRQEINIAYVLLTLQGEVISWDELPHSPFSTTVSISKNTLLFTNYG